jgi:DUF1680 family protein
MARATQESGARAEASSAGAGAGIVVDSRRSPGCLLKPVPIGAVRVNDAFWAPRLRRTREVTLPAQYEQCEQTGRIDNFRRVSGRTQAEYHGPYYNDSDVYKWLEAASFALALAPDGELERRLDAVIDDVVAAQSPDGYLNTYFTFEREGERWTDPTRLHEMYCAGHLIQAGIAHRRATGKATLLGVARRLADHICRTFGPGIRPGADGHEEIELALVELYRETGNRLYLERAGFFLDQRGQQPPLLGGQAYHQDHLPVREQAEIVGHAVRATYLACGMADVTAETGDSGLSRALEALWQSAYTRKAYVTGGLGARYQGEAFGEDYELPNDRAYAETCAAIGGLMWNWRQLLRAGEARFADWLETALYNGALSGPSLDGAHYFYQNPLADRGGHRRRPWFGTACCPPNIARLLMSLPGYLYSVSGARDPGGPAPAVGDGAAALWVHLYVAGTVRSLLPDGRRVGLRLETEYPWQGVVHITVTEAAEGTWALRLRVPGWCRHAVARVNGRAAGVEVAPGSYVAVERAWERGDTVELDLEMPVRRLVSHPRVLANARRVAVARGPFIYCVEGVDHPGVDVWDLELPGNARLTPERRADVLGGVTALSGEAVAVQPPGWDGQLYRVEESADGPERRAVRLTAIPYYAWANREPGPMQVWLRQPG